MVSPFNTRADASNESLLLNGYPIRWLQTGFKPFVNDMVGNQTYNSPNDLDSQDESPQEALRISCNSFSKLAWFALVLQTLTSFDAALPLANLIFSCAFTLSPD
jgi:hypothetical protein